MMSLGQPQHSITTLNMRFERQYFMNLVISNLRICRGLRKIFPPPHVFDSRLLLAFSQILTRTSCSVTTLYHRCE